MAAKKIPEKPEEIQQVSSKICGDLCKIQAKHWSFSSCNITAFFFSLLDKNCNRSFLEG